MVAFLSKVQPYMKSNLRIQAEAALDDAGVQVKNCVFVDKSKLSRRIKFSHVRPNAEQMTAISHSVVKRFPGQRTEVGMSARPAYPGAYLNAYSGLYIKVWHKS